MIVAFAAFAVAAGACSFMHGLSHRSDPGRAAVWAMGALAAVAGLAVIEAMRGNWPAAGVFAAYAALWAWRAWRNWRRRGPKRSLLEILGYKMRAVFAQLARSMPRPGPVPRLVPQGARA